jgi:hypothetical protein
VGLVGPQLRYHYLNDPVPPPPPLPRGFLRLSCPTCEPPPLPRGVLPNLCLAHPIGFIAVHSP